MNTRNPDSDITHSDTSIAATATMPETASPSDEELSHAGGDTLVGSPAVDKPSKSDRRPESRKNKKSKRTRKPHSSGFQKPTPILLRPFRKLIYIWNHWEIGSKFTHNLLRSSRRVMTFRGSEFHTTVEGKHYAKKWPSLSTSLNPGWWFLWTTLFAWRWLKSRPFAPMLLAIPSVATVLTCIAISLGGSAITPGTQGAIYRSMLAESIKTNDIGKARLAADALARLNPDSPEYAFRRALVEVEADQMESARSLMENAAKTQGSAKAAMWLAKSIRLDQPFEQWPTEVKSEYFDWLALAITHNPSDPIPRRILGDVLRSVGDSEQAYNVMLPIADSSPENACIVAYLEHELGKTEKAVARVSRLERGYLDRIESSPKDISARTQWAMMLILLGREPDAVRILSEGLAWTDNPKELQALRKSLTEALVLDANKIRREDTTPRGLMRSLERLREAMSIDPTNPNLLTAVVETCLRTAKSSNRELVILREAVIQGISSDASHFILGTMHLLQGQVEEGSQHLEVAMKNNPNLPGLLNNLAYSILQEEDPDLERALRLSNAAVASLPDNPYVRETRGRIYLEMEDYTQAISDLEFALTAPEIRATVRKGLIEAYESTGNQAYAERHRQLLERSR